MKERERNGNGGGGEEKKYIEMVEIPWIRLKEGTSF